MKAAPHALVLPLLEPPPARHPRSASHLLGQVLPGDARLQDEQDASQDLAIVDSPAPWKAHPTLDLGDQRLDYLPQLVRDDRLWHGVSLLRLTLLPVRLRPP